MTETPASADTTPGPKKPRLPFGLKTAYGAGSAAFGVKDAGFSYFLLIFYSQVIGVDARLVGLALTLALILDAVSDPIVGYWSDRFRSRWGRRHPFMYFAIAPTALCFTLLWIPPAGWSETALFFYVLVLAILTRTFITFFETPSAALAPELTSDYDERSSLLSYRSFFGWTGGNAMTVMMFFFLFPAFVTEAIPNGQFNRDAYSVYGIVAGALMAAAMLASALGTHGQIPRLIRPEVGPRASLGSMAKDIRETLANRSFVALLLAAVIAAVGAGLASSLSVYFSTYFWGFSSERIALLTLAIFFSAFLGAALAPMATRKLGKRNAAVALGVLSALISPIPIALRLSGVLTGGNDETTFWVVFAFGQIDVCLVVCLQVLVVSMMADIAEDSETRTGRRSEGLFFSANTFIAKLVTGLGVMAAAQVLNFAGFPVGAQPSDVGEDALMRLGTAYIPLILLLRLATPLVLLGYTLTRQSHQSNLDLLASRRGSGDLEPGRDRA
jgi:Na+/melibiose symporter-like transporter